LPKGGKQKRVRVNSPLLLLGHTPPLTEIIKGRGTKKQRGIEHFAPRPPERSSGKSAGGVILGSKKRSTSAMKSPLRKGSCVSYRREHLRRGGLRPLSLTTGFMGKKKGRNQRR